MKTPAPTRDGQQNAAGRSTVRRSAAIGAVVALLWLSSVGGAHPDSGHVPQDPALAEDALRAAIHAWAYDQYWRLHAMGSQESRARLSEKEFVDRMERGSSAPGIGLDVLDVRIAGVRALITASLRMEYRHYGPYLRNRPPFAAPTDRTVQVMLVYQEGAWRIDLHQFVGLASY